MEIANLIQAVSAVKTDNSTGRAGKGQSDFSDKLAAALDHVMPAEKTALKSTETHKNESSKDSKATEGETANRDAATPDKDVAASDKDVATSVKDDKAETKDVLKGCEKKSQSKNLNHCSFSAAERRAREGCVCVGGGGS